MKLNQISSILFFALLLPMCATHAANHAATNITTTIPWSEIGAKAGGDYQGDGLSVTATEAGARLRCVFQRLEGEATTAGLWLTSTVTNQPGDRFRVIAKTVAGKALAANGVVALTGQTVRFTRPILVEEYSVSMDGVQQDFVVKERPENNAPMRVRLDVSGARVEWAAYGAQFALKKSGRKIAYSRLRATDANGKELPVRIEPDQKSETSLEVIVNDVGAVYPVRIDPTFSDVNWLGLGVAPYVNGTIYTAVADSSGNVYVGGNFTMAGNTPANGIAQWNGSNWTALGTGISGPSEYPASPEILALAVSGNTLYVGGQFTNAGGVSANCLAQWNGSNWTALGAGMSGRVYSSWATSPTVSALAVSGNILYAGGYFTNAGGILANCIAQWDGHKWASLGSGISGLETEGTCVSALAASGSTLYVGGSFTTAGGVSANCIAQWNGSSWSALGSGMGGGNAGGPFVCALAVSGNTLYAGGDFTTAGNVTGANYIAQWNGSSWSALGSGMGGGEYASDVLTLVVSGNTLYAGGGFTTAGNDTNANCIARWNGTSWSALGSGPGMFQQYGNGLGAPTGGVSALAALGANLFVVWGGSGLVDIFGRGTQGNSVAQWDGTSWVPQGSALGGTVDAMVVSGSTLYVGGSFTYAGSTAVNNIAQWDGNGWTALGSGILGTNEYGAAPEVLALAMSGTTLYAGGTFTIAGGMPASCIAQWDGNGWTALGSGISGTNEYGSGPEVCALAVSGNTLYVGGEFTNAGGVLANCIAQWNGSSWSALGSGMSGSAYTDSDPSVNALAVSGSNLYAGGTFTYAGKTAVNNIAQWNGASWLALGSGVSPTLTYVPYAGYVGPTVVTALALSGGTLYAGGSFAAAGSGIVANSIARWDGNSWSALGAGLVSDEEGTPAIVSALVDYGGILYVGGWFIEAGGLSAQNFAQWDGSHWSASGAGMNQAVNALAVSDNTLYTGGYFTTADAAAAYAAETLLTGAPVNYMISLSVSPGAGGMVAGAGTFTAGSSQTVSAMANPGYTFVNWTSNDVVVNLSTNYSFTLDGSVTLVANFAPNVATGSLMVTISPTAVNAKGALWEVDSNGSFQVSGATSAGLLIGAHTVSFKTIPNWNTPSNELVTIANGKTTVASGLYTPLNAQGNTVTLVTNGDGVIEHAAWPKNLVPGEKYTVTAMPRSKNLFVDWVGGTSQPYSVLSAAPSYTFVFETNLSLEANFVTNVFLAAAGTYHGLFAPTNVARGQMNSGSFQISVTSAGTVSGSLDLGGQTVSLLPQKLSLGGAATVISKRPRGESALTTTLQLDFADQSIMGTVTDGSTFTAQLEGDLDVFSVAHKATGFSGAYTLIVPGTNDPAVGPYGASYGTLNVSSVGAITLAGSLADGTAISQSSVVSKDGYWPMYVNLYGGKGSIWGWNLFTNQTIVSAPVFSWINETNSSKTAVYRAGFTNEEATLTGGWHLPANGLPGNFAVTLEGGNLPFIITNGVTITLSDKVVTNSVEDTNKLNLTINKTTGVITGTFANPSNPKQTIKIYGVTLQGQTNAQGYFLGTNQSGAILLEQP